MRQGEESAIVPTDNVPVDPENLQDDDGDATLLDLTLTPAEIVDELDRYIIGQDAAKRAVAIALRNRARRQMLSDEMRDEVLPKNILMIGPTGVGKTEIARRLARLSGAPFIKVEASKFTEVGYVGRDVESMIRDLVETAVGMVRTEFEAEVEARAEDSLEDRLLDALLPTPPRAPILQDEDVFGPDDEHVLSDEPLPRRSADDASERFQRTRERLREKLRAGQFEDRTIEIEVQVRPAPFIEVMTPGGMEDMDINLRDMLGGLLPKQTRKREVTVAEARPLLLNEETERLIDMDMVVSEALQRVEESGMVFLDEIDKIVGSDSRTGPDVSREGVQRDILPIVEGCSLMTKYGMVHTDHILFVAAGAFHAVKPSDLIPELQGRFPIRVELDDLTEDDFRRILTEPRNALSRQYVALLATENLTITITDDAINEIAAMAFRVNRQTENIGARRLHTIMERVVEIISFEAPDRAGTEFLIDADYVREQLADTVQDEDLSRYIL